jgi:hypothetical protein
VVNGAKRSAETARAQKIMYFGTGIAKVASLTTCENVELFDESHAHEQWYSVAIADVKSRFQCAGINRHEAENGKFLRGRSSDPLGPEFCVGYREVHGEA